MENIAYYNGNYTTLEELQLPVLDRAVYFGDGVYEAMYVRNGIPYGMGDHLDRFYESLRSVKIAPPAERAEFEAFLLDLTKRLGGEGILYWQTSRGSAYRAHTFPEGAAPNLLAWFKHKKLADPRAPFRLMTTEDRRYSFCHVKTLNLILNVMAAEEAKENGCDEAVFVRDGIVTEGAHTNIHLLKDGALITHPLDCHILPGTVRRQLIRLCGSLRIPVMERAFAPEEMETADEILVTSSTSFIRRASVLNRAPVGGHALPLYDALLSAYLADVAAVCGEN